MSSETEETQLPSSSLRGAMGVESARKINEQSYDFEHWKITALKSTILPSNCYCSNLSDNDLKTIMLGESSDSSLEQKCQVCRFATMLNLKHLPEMVFPDNVLQLTYKPTGFSMDFNTLDAMKMISVKAEPVILVACSADWQASKAETGLPTEAAHSFNWTFTTEYKGSIRKDTKNPSTIGDIEMEPSEKINLEKLKRRENILFFDEMTLYEDELHDNGVSNLTAKIRVMPSGFFILQRFFLRVDNVMARICDTRIHYEIGKKYFLREFQVREESFKKLEHLESSIHADPNMLYSYLPIVRTVTEKIKIAE